MNLGKVLTIFFCVLFLVGCAGTQKMYIGERKDRSEVAVVIIPNQLRFVSVDGEKVDHLMAHSKVELLPGRHIIELTYLQDTAYYSYEPFDHKTIELDAEAGKEYIIKSKTEGSMWIKECTWEIWIEDKTGRNFTFKEVVSEGY